MEFAEQLREKRREKGMTQDALAEALDVSRQAVAKWEAGQSFPSTENLLELRELLGIIPEKKEAPRETPPGPPSSESSGEGKKEKRTGEKTPGLRRGRRALVALAILAAFGLGYAAGAAHEGHEERFLDSQVAAIMESMDMEPVYEYVETVVEPPMDEDRFTVCAVRVLGYDEDHLYLCVYTSRYHKASLEISPIGGSLLAVALDVELDGETARITGYSVPEDGADYGRTLSKIFPDALRGQLDPSEEELDAMRAEVSERAKKLFESQTQEGI